MIVFEWFHKMYRVIYAEMAKVNTAKVCMNQCITSTISLCICMISKHRNTQPMGCQGGVQSNHQN